MPIALISCLMFPKVLEPDPVDLASVGLGGTDGGKGKGPSNGNPDDARWSGEARCGNVLHSVSFFFLTILVLCFHPILQPGGWI